MVAQTLMHYDIVPNDTTTMLTFTKLLNENAEMPIDPNDANAFTWAVGGVNALGHHVKRSPFKTDLSQMCGELEVIISTGK